MNVHNLNTQLRDDFNYMLNNILNEINNSTQIDIYNVDYTDYANLKKRLYAFLNINIKIVNVNHPRFAYHHLIKNNNM